MSDARQRKKIKKILREGRKERQRSAKAQASSGSNVKEDAADTRKSVSRVAGKTSATSSAQPSGSCVNENAENVCWKCGADVTNVENSKCAGCRKVTFANLSHQTASKVRPFFSCSFLT